jgi:hypothetical protein
MTHTVETTWRAARVAELEATAEAVDQLLGHLADVELALEGDDDYGSSSRSLAALLRSKRTELTSEARRLEAVAAENGHV